MRRWQPIIIAAALAGCAAPEVRYQTVPLPLPPRPELPRIYGEELQCLSEDAYRRIVERDRMRRAYAEQLEAVILSTHEEADHGG